jgi:hypothetical protein
MNERCKYRIGNQLILSWLHCGDVTLGELITNAIGDKELISLTDQELIDLLEKYCS